MESNKSWSIWSQHVLSELKRLNSFSEKTAEKLEEIKVSTIENTNSLKDHMRRTEIAEARLDKLEQELTDVRFFKRLLKVGTGLFVLPGCIYYTLHIIRILKDWF